jgi:hypothetical protein
VFKVEVVTPEEYMGDVIGDLNRRRGLVQGMEPRGNAQVVTAMVPLSEMFGYATDVRSMTQGRANYTMQFERYDEVPPNIADKVVEARTGEPVPPRRARFTGFACEAGRARVRIRDLGNQRSREQWRRRSSSGRSRTSTSAPSGTSTMARRR